MPAPTTVEEYIATLPADRRATLEELRAVVRAAAPDADEAISYQMPALRLDGRLLVSYASFARHASLFPASEAVRRVLGEELTPYLSGKGTIRFPAGSPLPRELIRRVVEARLVEHAASGRA